MLIHLLSNIYFSGTIATNAKIMGLIQYKVVVLPVYEFPFWRSCYLHSGISATSKTSYHRVRVLAPYICRWQVFGFHDKGYPIFAFLHLLYLMMSPCQEQCRGNVLPIPMKYSNCVQQTKMSHDFISIHGTHCMKHLILVYSHAKQPS